jgi:predicted amidohydrolase
MNRLLRLGLVQMDAILGVVKANLERALGYVQEAKQNQVDILCFPELFSTGYNPALLGDRYYALAEPVSGPTIQRLARAARENGLHIVAPIVLEKSVPGVIHNAAVVLGGDGQNLGSFSKVHLPFSERLYFRAGDEYPVFETDFGKLGIMICYDAGFPEVARLLALQGAEIILAPCAFRKADKHMWDIYFRARALENTFFVAATNRVGQEGDLHLFGSAVVSNPTGILLAESPEDQENLLVADVDLEEVRAFRARMPFLRDRRPELYGGLLDAGR